MHQQQPTAQYDAPSYQFVTDPNYDETLSGRVRAACITCSRRKVKCTGRIPCETCLNHNKTCEGFKKATRWDSRRKVDKRPVLNTVGVPLEVRRLSSDRNSSGGSTPTPTKEEGPGHNIMNRFSIAGHTQSRQSLEFSINPSERHSSFGELNAGCGTLPDGCPTTESIPNSVCFDPLYLRDMVPMLGDDSSPSLLGQNSSGPDHSSFIMAAECLENQARMLRSIVQRGTNTDGRYLDVSNTAWDNMSLVPGYGSARQQAVDGEQRSLRRYATEDSAYGSVTHADLNNSQHWLLDHFRPGGD